MDFETRVMQKLEQQKVYHPFIVFFSGLTVGFAMASCAPQLRAFFIQRTGNGGAQAPEEEA
jgi:hypothetical protein